MAFRLRRMSYGALVPMYEEGQKSFVTLWARHISVATLRVPGLMFWMEGPLGVGMRGKGVSAHGRLVIVDCKMI